MCPTVCGIGQLVCPEGTDANGCPLPDTCKTGKLNRVSHFLLVFWELYDSKQGLNFWWF